MGIALVVAVVGFGVSQGHLTEANVIASLISATNRTAGLLLDILYPLSLKEGQD
jgi:hypothetical protein